MCFRRSTGSRSASRSGLAALCLILASGGALADWIDDYKAGVAALDRSDYDRAIQLLGKAVSNKPREKASAIKSTGMFYEPYLPHYHLGLAYFGKRDYERALRELRVSADQGVIGKYGQQKSNLENHLKLCEQQMAAVPAPPPARDDGAARELAAARERSSEALKAAGDFLQTKGSQLTAGERASIEAGIKELAAASDAESIATRTVALRGALDSAAGRVAARDTRPARTGPAPPPTPERPARELGRMPPGPGAKERTGGAETAPKPNVAPVPPPPARPERTERIDPAPSGRATTEEAAKMRLGVESYFKGDDEAVQAALAGVEQAEADFYLGSSLYRRYLLGRGQDESLKEEAARCFRRVRQAEPGYRPDPRYFSPKVIAFFRQTTGSR